MPSLKTLALSAVLVAVGSPVFAQPIYRPPPPPPPYHHHYHVPFHRHYPRHKRQYLPPPGPGPYRPR